MNMAFTLSKLTRRSSARDVKSDLRSTGIYFADTVNHPVSGHFNLSRTSESHILYTSRFM